MAILPEKLAKYPVWDFWLIFPLLYILLLHLARQYLLAQESVNVNGTLEIKTGPCVLYLA